MSSITFCSNYLLVGQSRANNSFSGGTRPNASATKLKLIKSSLNESHMPSNTTKRLLSLSRLKQRHKT